MANLNLKSILFGLLFTGLSPALANAQSSALLDVQNFALALGVKLNTQRIEQLRQYDLIVVDGENTTREQVSQLKSAGTITLAYLSVGTIERYRSWYGQAKNYRLELWEDWGEWYADVADLNFRSLILKRVAPKIVAKGFDGLFLDNVDMIQTHRSQASGMLKLVKSLSALLRKDGKYLFMQNGDEIVSRFVSYLDGWNREDVTSTYNFRKKRYQRVKSSETEEIGLLIAQLKDAGLLVTTTDYTAAVDVSSTTSAVDNSCRFGAIPFVSNIQLSRLPDFPIVCE